MEKVFKFFFFTTFHFHTVRARAHIQPSNIINFHGFLVITIIKFPQGSRLALSANFCAASSPLSLAAMVPDTDLLQVLLIESNTGRVFRTLNEWRIARLPRRGNARFLDETRLWTPASLLGFRSWKSWDGEVACVHSVVLKLSILISVVGNIIVIKSVKVVFRN